MALITFDATAVEPDAGFVPIPAGTYVAQIIDSDVKTTKAGTGQYLQLTWKVLDGPYHGRLVFDRLNIRNSNQTAEQIGQKALSSLCHVTGVLRLQDSSQLHSKPVQVRVTIRKDAEYGDQNEIKGYAQAQGFAAPQAAAMPPAAQAAPPATQAPAPQAASVPPWAGQAPQNAPAPAWAGQPQQQQPPAAAPDVNRMPWQS